MEVRPAVHFFLTSRPYSYASEISRALVFCLAVSPTLNGTLLFAVAMQSLSVWLYFNWQSEWIQRDPRRIRPVPLLFLVPLAIGAIIGGLYGSASGALGVVAYAATICIYSAKARSRFFGPWGPVMRMTNGMAQFLMVSVLVGERPSDEAWRTAILLSVWLGTRNLIGDIRDIDRDQFELPARFGPEFSLWCCRAGFLFTFVLLTAQTRSFFSAEALTVLISAGAVESVRLAYGHSEASKWGYVAHRFVILSSVALHLALAIGNGLPKIWVLVIASMALVLHPFYSQLPGKDFPKFSDLLKFRRKGHDNS